MYVKYKGIGLEKDYPFEGSYRSCRIKPDTKRYDIKGSKQLTPPLLREVKKQLLQKPISVSMEADKDFMLYKDGIYQNDSQRCGHDLNHAILLVGMKDDYFML